MKVIDIKFFAIATLMLLSVPSNSQSAVGKPVKLGTPLLLVVNQGDASLSFVDPSRKESVATLLEGVPTNVGHEVVASPDSRLAYVPLYGDSGVGKPGVDGRIMLVVDIVSGKIVRQVDFGHGVRPHCVLYDKKRDLLYVTTELDKTITIVDPKTLKVVGAIPTKQEQSHMLAVAHDGRFGYTANVGPGTVSVHDMGKRSLITIVPIAATTQRIAISNDDRMVFTSDQTKPRMAVIDTATNAVRTWIELPSLGYGSSSTLDGKQLLVTLPTTGQLAVVDLQALKVVKTLEIGPRPQEVLVRPDGATAYVSCFGGKKVVVVNIATMTVTGSIEVGTNADGMAWVDGLKPHVKR